MFSTEWPVGPGRALTVPSQAAAVAKDGDTVSIDAGRYTDCATWRQNNLLLRGVGGMAHVSDKSCGGKAIWVIQGRNTTVRDIEFSGATVPDKNGAGIRQEGADLLVERCYFHGNENGILTGANPASSIRVVHSVFEGNGFGDGYSHNMYIGHVGRFEITGSWTHHAKVGHNIKSRADTNIIRCNRISNGSDGTASRDIDLPNGGWSLIEGNEIQHGPQNQNSNTCGYGLEGLSNPAKVLVVRHNTFVNQRSAGTFVMVPASGMDSVRVINNLMAGAGSMFSGGAAVLDTQANAVLRSIADAHFTDAAAYNYHLTAQSPAVDAGISHAQNPAPLFEYVHPAGLRARPLRAAPDLGAYEFEPSTGSEYIPSTNAHPELHAIFPNPAGAHMSVSFRLARPTTVRLRLLTVLGEEVMNIDAGACAAGEHVVALDISTLRRGLYWLLAGDTHTWGLRGVLLH